MGVRLSTVNMKMSLFGIAFIDYEKRNHKTGKAGSRNSKVPKVPQGALRCPKVPQGDQR